MADWSTEDPMKSIAGSIATIRAQAVTRLARTDTMVEYLRTTCRHARAVRSLGIVLCPECGASWGAEDPARPKAQRVTVAAFAEAERVAPEFFGRGGSALNTRGQGHGV